MEIDDVNLAVGIDPIILGPGHLEAAHTPEESASFQQIVQASEIYLHFALSL
jgi:acetylornithine deacetylase/succinyl-diaminopimelate desuccinylase-like protein